MDGKRETEGDKEKIYFENWLTLLWRLGSSIICHVQGKELKKLMVQLSV